MTIIGAKATSTDDVRRYFVELEAVLKKFNQMDKPERLKVLMKRVYQHPINHPVLLVKLIQKKKKTSVTSGEKSV